MTPQLQQAIKLLQLSNIELQSEIQEIIDSNPLLETEDNNEATLNGAEPQATTTSSDSINEKDTSEQLADDKITSELDTDTHWEDWGYVSQGVTSTQHSDDSSHFDYQGETSESLRDKLQWQVDMMNLSHIDRTIAMILIDGINERGYVQTNLEDIISMLTEETDVINLPSNEEPSIEIEEVEAVLHLLQSFEPAGIAARNLQECLLIQIKRLNKDDEAHQLAQKVLETQFDNLSSRNYRLILRKLSISEQQLKKALETIQSLNPRPGNQINQDTAQYITPDVFVKKNGKGQWTVDLNNSSTPKLTINDDYASLIKRADNSKDNVYLKNNLQDAKWFIKSLQSRNDTLLKVASCIVSKQTGFLEYGEEAMKPLVLNDIAEEVEMHESTISRVTTQKFMHTPKGVFELKYFFSSHVGTTSGGECSSTAIRAVIKKLISAENQGKPLSDNKLANLLKDQGIKVARRTVAKYREAMSIPPSNERKKLI